MTRHPARKQRAQVDNPVRIGILDDCPYRRAAIREALIESRRYVVPLCAPVPSTDLTRSHGLDALLVAVAPKGTPKEVSERRIACSRSEFHGEMIGYALHSFSQGGRLDARRMDLDAVFHLPDHPTQFVAHLDRFFGFGAVRGEDGQSGIHSARRPLSAREREVFDLFGSGKEIKAVAAHLGVSPKTVYKFTDRIRRKHGYATLHDLLFAAARCRWNEPGV